MLDEKEYGNFVDMDPNWVSELLNKIGKGPKGRDNKIRCFSYLFEEIKPFFKYLPKLGTALRSVLE